MTVEESFSEKIFTFVKNYSNFIGVISSFILALLFVYTTIWQLSIVAGFIGGLFYKRMKYGAIAGLVGVGTAWLIFVVIDVLSTNVNSLLDQIGSIILGVSGLGWIFILIVILLGFIFGVLSGSIGSAVRMLLKKQD
ncbi:MAG: hypothetical protein V3V41_03775 [Candidatus Heimdallarchaeota archaeon]